MLPAAEVAEIGERLAELFQLPFWQITQTATDANRMALRWARALTGRSKVLVFDGCYHGTVEETLVSLDSKLTTQARPGLIGPAYDYAHAGCAVPFNDLPALEQALARGDCAALLLEPAMTNAGMILPQPGFLTQALAAARRAGALIILDETHTLSSGLGACRRAQALDCDFWVCGKAIAGGVACAVLGFTRAVAEAMAKILDSRPAGHSGMGTTLAANTLAMNALLAALRHLHTAENYALMAARAEQLRFGLTELFARHQLDWQVTQVGARTEFGFGIAPRNAADVRRQAMPKLEHLLHIYWLNRGVLVTPFHNMMLTTPVTTSSEVARLLDVLHEALLEIFSSAQ
jgi:glutamate-1-semialdehyde 2,1-aminomutase